MSGVITGFLVANAAWIAPTAAIVGAGTSLGELGANLANSGGSSSTGNNTAQATAQAQLAAQNKAAFLAAQPQVQSNTSGSLTPGADNAATSAASGVPIPNDLNALLQKITGGGGGSTTPSAPISGGSTAANAQQPQNTLNSLSDLLKT